MKLLVFSERAGFRRQVEDLLTSTPHPFESYSLADMLAKGKNATFDGLLVDHESWQRCASLMRYFSALENVNQKPVLVFSKSKKTPLLKLRRVKAVTVNCPVPVQNEDFYSALQQMSSPQAA